MKPTLLVLFLIAICSCSKYTVLKPENIASVHPVFKDTSSRHFGGYKLANGVVVRYDRDNAYLKEFLAANRTSMDTIGKDPDTGRLFGLIRNKRIFKPIPIPVKVLPFVEFGYIKTTDGKVISYATGDYSLYDITGNRVYSE